MMITATEPIHIIIVTNDHKLSQSSPRKETPMETVNFINMADGTEAEYQLLDGYEKDYVARLPERIVAALVRQGQDSIGGYQMTRLEHALQSATRAHRDGRDEAYVVAALLHDIGDELAPYSHSEMAAAVLRPYVSERIYWIVKQHGLFQMYYYAHHLGGDRNARDKFKDHRWYQDAVEFCERYDQNCFDPEYDSEPLSFFEPMIQRVLGATPSFDREHMV